MAKTPRKKPTKVDRKGASACVLPPVLYEDILRQDCVLFAGAGITTEGRRRYSERTFYDDVMRRANYPASRPDPTFPELMSHFCEEIDGGQHNRLTRMAIEHIEPFVIVDKLRSEATEFARGLSEIPYFDRVVTTNWDPFLERSLGVLVPMVEDRDLAFWDDTKRQVLKIHGCITRPSTLVATCVDYEECITQRHLIFNKLRDLMATKTFIFVGYSMRDSDFLAILDEITRSLGPIRKLAYSFDPNATEKEIQRWKGMGIRVLKSKAEALLTELRDKLEAEDLIPTHRFRDFLSSELERIAGIHLTIDQGDEGGIASAIYQDGLMHALEDVLANAALGRKREEFWKFLQDTEADLARVVREEDLTEITYLSGWREVYRRYCDRLAKPIPIYFHPRNLVPVARYVRA